MNTRLDTILTALGILGFILSGVLWVNQYVMPKSATLDAAAACMYDQGLSQDATAESKAAWGECLQGAEEAHATPLLLALGY